jgi:hypothetical protein
MSERVIKVLSDTRQGLKGLIDDQRKVLTIIRIEEILIPGAFAAKLVCQK